MTMLSGWGHYPQADCRQKTARSIADISATLAQEPQLIARGMGRSYGDAALNTACTLDMKRMNRMLDFDETTGSLICESGVTLADILTTFIPRGWFIPVTPGTKFVTVGGMLAADVHGKNHHKAGSFGDYVEAFDLALADGRIVTCTHSQNPDLFAATRGGMGLTGVILRLTFRLMHIETAFMHQETVKARNLDEVMEQFEASANTNYSVAWIDCLATGDTLGRSLLYLGEHALPDECSEKQRAKLLSADKQKSLSIPRFFPPFMLNRFTVRAFNALYYRIHKPGKKTIGYHQFFYPLDGLHHWHRLYGRKGFVQYQCVIPKANSKAGLQSLLSEIAISGTGPFLAVLKLLGPGGPLMSFPMEGYTLALDFPATAKVFDLLDRLDDIVEEHGGRIYLAKDARSSPEAIQKGYSALQRFQEVRHSWQAAERFSSLLSQRLKL
jgi:FAD/FMN-containing dehydrogenase